MAFESTLIVFITVLHCLRSYTTTVKCVIRCWMIFTIPLTGNWLKSPLHFAFPSTSNNVVNFMTKRVKYCCHIEFYLDYMFTIYISGDEKGIESVAEKMGQDSSWWIKWLGLPVRLPDTLRHGAYKCWVPGYPGNWVLYGGI